MAECTVLASIPVIFGKEPANKIFAGPESGADAVPTMRSLAIDDIPDLSDEYLPTVNATAQGVNFNGSELALNGINLKVGTYNGSGYTTNFEVAAVGSFLADANSIASDGNGNLTAVSFIGSGASLTNVPHLAYIVAASNATDGEKQSADYVCDGTADDVEIKSALHALPATGGRVVLTSGDYYITDQINIIPNHATLDCSAAGSINLTGVLAGSSLIANNSKCFAFARGAGARCNISIGSGSVAVFQLSEEYAFDNGAPVYIGAITTLATGLSQTTQYYVRDKDAAAGTFSIATTVGGTPVTISDTGSGSHFAVYAFYSYDHTTNTLTVLGAAPPVFTTGQAIGLNVKTGSTTPSGLSALPQIYYLSRIGSTNTYNAYLDPGLATAPTTTDDGSGHLLIMTSLTENSEVIGVNLIMSAASATAGNHGMKFSRNQLNCRWVDCKVSGGANGIVLSGSKPSVIGGVCSSPTGNGVLTGTIVDSPLIDGLSIIGAGANGIGSNGIQTNNAKIVNCNIILSGKEGIKLAGGGAVIVGNNVLNNARTTAAYDIDVSGQTLARIGENTITPGTNSLGSVNPNSDTTFFDKDGNFTAEKITARGIFSAASGHLTVDASGNVTGLGFIGNGTQLVDLDASNLSTGTVAIARLSQASTSTSGYLSSTDWNTFNGKDAGGAAATVQTNLSTHAALTTAHGSTNANTASTIVQRDASGNFSAGTITGTLSGNASTVTTNANLTGPITSVGNATSIASQTGTGSTFVMSAAPAIAGGSHTAITGLGIRSTGAAFDLTLATAEVLTAGRTLSIVLGDAARTLTFAGNASISGTNTGDQTSVTGNAGTATALQTARAINGVNFDGTAAITVTAAAGTLAGTTLASNVVTSSLTSIGTLAALTVNAAAPSSVICTDTTTSVNKQIVFVGTNTIFEVWNSANAASAPSLGLKKSRGTIASPAAVTSGDFCGAHSFFGHDGTSYLNRAVFQAKVDGAVSTGVVPMAFVFLTGSSIATERGRIASNGNWLIGTSTDNGGIFQLVAGTASAGTAPLKFNSGTLNTTAEAGAVEYNGDLYATDSAGIRSRLTNQPQILSTITGINAKTVANTLLYTVPTGKTCIVTGYTVRCSAASSITVGSTAGAGSASGTNDIASPQAMSALTTTTTIFNWPIIGMSVAVPAAGTVYFNLTVAATGTSQTIIVDLIGYLV